MASFDRAKLNNTILVANHIPQARDFLEQPLSAHYNIVSAESTAVAWEQTKINKVDFIFLEEDLPSLGGQKLLRLLMIAYPHIPIVLTSENPTPKGCVQAFRYGARDCFCKPDNEKEIIYRVDQIINNVSERGSYGKNYYLEGIYDDLSPKERKMLEELPHLRKNNIRIAIDYLHKNFRERISKDHLCKIACLSSSHFSRIFKKNAGCSYIKYLANIRINKAKELLKDGNLNVTEVCYSVGYRDLSNFERTFHKMVGCCPRDYQKKYVPNTPLYQI